MQPATFADTAGPMARHSVPAVDTSRVPRGEIAARTLVDAVVAGDDRLERHYLEIKGPLDLTTKKDQAKLVKFILGAANRMPDKAAAAFEGYAVMIIGATAGAAPGVPPVEALVIENAVRPFIGTDGPRWDLVRVPVAGGNDVLLLLVDPPRVGQGPFFCLKDGEGLRDGGVYVRADGETREAKADEQKALQRREASGRPSVDFGVSIAGQVERIGLDFETACNDYINSERIRLLDALAPSRPKPSSARGTVGQGTLTPANPTSEMLSPTPAMSAVADSANLAGKIYTASAFMDEPEKRTEAEYEAEIDEWEGRVRAAWPSAVKLLVAANLNPVTIQLVNRVETYFHDVQLKIHLEGEVRGETSDGARKPTDPAGLGLPEPPRVWGPTSRRFSPANADYSSLLARSIASGFSTATPSRLEWHNSGSVDITFYVGDLRPTETDTCSDEDLALTVPARLGVETVRGTWEITARDHNKVYRGDLQVPVVERDLTGILRVVLGLDEPAT